MKFFLKVKWLFLVLDFQDISSRLSEVQRSTKWTLTDFFGGVKWTVSVIFKRKCFFIPEYCNMTYCADIQCFWSCKLHMSHQSSAKSVEDCIFIHKSSLPLCIFDEPNYLGIVIALSSVDNQVIFGQLSFFLKTTIYWASREYK